MIAMSLAAGYTIKLAVASVLFLPGAGLVKPAIRPAASPCSKWLNKTNDKTAKLGEQRWRNTIVAALGEGSCASVPEALRDASREASRVREAWRRDRLLADAAAKVLGPSCTVVDPANDSRDLAKVCPLPVKEEFSGLESVFRDIRAVDYVLVNALATSLIASDAYDAAARRLMLNFLLSATLLGEKPRQ